MAWVPMKDQISKTTYGKAMLKLLKDDVLVQRFIQFNSQFDAFVPGYFQSTKAEREETVKMLLEGKKLSPLDSLCIRLLWRILPYSLEAPYIAYYLTKRLSPNSLSTIELLRKNELDILTNADFLKLFESLSRLEELDENYIENTIVVQATKKYKASIENEIQKNLDLFMAEMRGNWMKKIGELRETIKQQNDLIKNLEKAIWSKMPTKEFCRMIYVRLEKLEFPLSNMYSYCFSSKINRMKRYANITRRQIHQIRHLIELKMKDISTKEELEAIDAVQMKKDGSFWHSYIYNLIKQNKTWFKTYSKLSMATRLQIVTEIGRDTPDFTFVHEKDDYFMHKIEETYNKYIPMLETSKSSNSMIENEEWEEMEEDQNINALTNSLINKLNESDGPP